jgi:ArsR family transcriptional regulator
MVSNLAADIDRCQYTAMVVLPLAEAQQDCGRSIVDAAVSKGEAEVLARGFAALADPSRLRLLSMIASQPAGEVCACALVEPVGKSQPTISHHLRILYEAGLVDRERRGTWIWYRAVPSRVEALRAALSPQQAVG